MKLNYVTVGEGGEEQRLFVQPNAILPRTGDLVEVWGPAFGDDDEHTGRSTEATSFSVIRVVFNHVVSSGLGDPDGPTVDVWLARLPEDLVFVPRCECKVAREVRDGRCDWCGMRAKKKQPGEPSDGWQDE